MTQGPPLVVSMGDPAGVGLEIVARTRAQAKEAPRFVLLGDPDAYRRAATRIGFDDARVLLVDRITAAQLSADALDILPMPLARVETPGVPDPANATAIIAAIETGATACLRGEARALVTLPIAKAPLQAAGFGFPGHTEFIAHLCKDAPWPDARGPVMMLACDALKVALATIHEPLSAVAPLITRERVMNVTRVVAEAMARDFGLAAPRIALAGLNPHAGETGAIGREEERIINPAAAALRAEGVNVSDARSADTLFHDAARATYDAAIAMYHDQALIPIKTLDFWGAVNVTLGLPIVRTSPDHGTGFDIAGQGVARTDSFIAALRMADAMAQRRAHA
ncbi:MAG: 4-hydroxythreonine-4-phosphate dehydrogenase PdxA [Alphaproteobacteria bacterium]|nr:4-hydroxythreonine-4-phosphate dehydrogenase PdxA [Alphaproteobacteria bacterium]